MFSKKTCWLYVACVTLFYTHLQQDDKNPTVYFQMNQRSHKFKVLIPKNYINKASFYISFAITPAFVAPHWYPINHRDSPTVTCLWGLRWRLRDKHSSEEARIKYPAVSHPETSDMSMVYSFSFIIWITASKMQDRRPTFFYIHVAQTSASPGPTLTPSSVDAKVHAGVSCYRCHCRNALFTVSCY